MSLLHSKTYIASGAIADRRIVRPHAANAGQVVLAAAATESLLGIVNQPRGVVNGERVDVVHIGETLCEAGAAFAAGALITADATGRAIVAAPAAGVNNRVVGVALEAATAAGDLTRILISPCMLQG